MKIWIQWHTANMCNGITVKTHQKTVKMNYSGLLYYVQVFAIQGTCRSVDGTYNNPLYFKFTVISLHLEQQLHVENTVENCKLDYSALQWFTVLCTIVSICPIFVVQWKYLPCIKRRKARMPYICIL